MKLSNDSKLGILTAICQLVMVVMFKNILHIQPNIFTGYGPIMIFLIYIISKDSMKKSDRNSLYWGAAIIFATLATIVLHAFF